MRPIPEACRDRKWLSVSKQLSPPAAAVASSLTVMNYNVLCQKLIQRRLFPYASKPSLKWKTRRPLLLSELSHLKPDIMCLQEVFTKNWDDTFSMWFNREGYKAESFQSVSKSHCLSISWKEDRFAAVDRTCVRMDRSAEVLGETLHTNNVAQIVVLRFLQDSDLSSGVPGVIVSNTHLFWQPGACYERLQQQLLLSRALNQMRRKYPEYPVISCGDYNTTPDDAGYALLTSPRPVKLSEEQLDKLLPQTLDYDGSDSEHEVEHNETSKASALSYSEMAATGTAAETDGTLQKRHMLELEERKVEEQLKRDLARVDRLVATIQKESEPFTSCYATYADLDLSYRTEQWKGEPIYTNYTNWKGTLDYILFTPAAGLSLRSVLSLPPETKLKPGLPNDVFPSDHIS
ncbi:RNA exonuclease ngl2, partial [Coemansia guatemalensis]